MPRPSSSPDWNAHSPAALPPHPLAQPSGPPRRRERLPAVQYRSGNAVLRRAMTPFVQTPVTLMPVQAVLQTMVPMMMTGAWTLR